MDEGTITPVNLAHGATALAPEQVDAEIAAAPDAPAVFLVHLTQGQPYLARTGFLRRRLKRLLGAREGSARTMSLREAVTRIEFYPTGSRLDSAMRFYDLARQYFPDTYLKKIRLRLPFYVRLSLRNEFPRTMLTTSLGESPDVCFGPFSSRNAAEKFESEALDLFQVRRCQEDLAPSAQHPGCMYGEMGMCLRPCQEVVGAAEYREEAARLAAFLRSGGQSLLCSVSSSREQLSAQMLFEEAAREHKRLQRIEEVLKLRDDLARDIETFHTITVTPGAGAVDLGFVHNGRWLGLQPFDLEVTEGKPVSMDHRLRETVAAVNSGRASGCSKRERQERMALLARWYFSTWRDGEMLLFDRFEEIPFRRLVNAISRVAAKQKSETGS